MAHLDAGNTLVMNQGLRPVVSFNFMMRVEGVYDMPCKSIHVIQKENEFEYIQEGGLNDYVHMKRKPISKPFTFEVERYCNMDFLDPLSLGTELVLPVFIFVSQYQGYDANPLYMSRVYVFTGCVVTGKRYGELDSEKSALLTETTTIAYREMFCINNPDVYFAKEPWAMDGRSSTERNNASGANPYTGNKKNKYAQSSPSKPTEKRKFDIHHPEQTVGVNDRNRPTEKRRQEMIDSRKIYDFEEPSVAVGRNDADRPPEMTKTQMKEAATRYDFHNPAETVGANLGVIHRPGDSDLTIRPAQKDKQQAEKAAKKYNFRKPLKRVGRNDTNRPPQLAKKEMKAKAEKYNFGDTTRTGRNDTGRPLQKTKQGMEKRATKYSFQTGINVGKNEFVHVPELSQEKMEAKARTWPPTKSAQTVASFLKKK